MRAFITGASGYIGSRLSSRLREEGHEVCALVRPTSRTEELERSGVATFVGDITDRVSMREGMSGADWVIHAAADLDMGGPSDRMKEANVTGSENVASLAHKLGVGRFLSISSIAAFGGSPADGSLADESSPRLPPPSLYSATKRAGEESVKRWAKKGLKVNTVFPSLVYGPPGKKKGANSLLRMVLKGRMPFLIGADRQTSWIFLDDLIEALARLMEKALPGADFILAGEVDSMRSVVRRFCREAGLGAPPQELPLPLARVAVGISAPFFKIRGRRPPFSSDHLSSLTRHWAFSDAEARRELGWAPRGLDEGLPPTVAMLRES